MKTLDVKKRCVFVADEHWALPHADMKRMADLYASAYEDYDFQRFHALTKEFGLPADRPLITFSKGMRRQAATILALCTGASVYFFDETFDGLDPVMRNLVKRKLYDEVFDRGATVIVTSHSLRELEDTCDQLALFYKGGIVLESDVSELKTSIFKMQVAFTEEYDKTKFEGLDMLSYSQARQRSHPHRPRRQGGGRARSSKRWSRCCSKWCPLRWRRFSSMRWKRSDMRLRMEERQA